MSKEFHEGRVSEHDWWDQVNISGYSLTSLPVQHWSRRIWQGTNTTLWSSYMLQTKNHVIYYGGDSGYFIGYKEFARKYPAIDYALLPTTAYHPRWFMHYSHMNVEGVNTGLSGSGCAVFCADPMGNISFRG